jgi:hypothetical protein
MTISQSELKRQFQYNPLTGLFTRLVSNHSKFKVGEIAGSLMKDGYIRISINHKHYLAHRLAWLYVYGYMPEYIDHVNGNRSWNLISNLRECTEQENSVNAKIRKDNSSGYKGVTYHEKTGKWQARCSHDKVRYCLGLYDTPEMASKVREEFAIEKHLEFYNRKNTKLIDITS